MTVEIDMTYLGTRSGNGNNATWESEIIGIKPIKPIHSDVYAVLWSCGQMNMLQTVHSVNSECIEGLLTLR